MVDVFYSIDALSGCFERCMAPVIHALQALGLAMAHGAGLGQTSLSTS